MTATAARLAEPLATDVLLPAVGVSAVGATQDRSPAQLLADAEELRDIAARLRVAARTSAELLRQVLRADVPQTWVGPWAQACGQAFQEWQQGADATATRLVDRARELDAHADELADRAALAAAPS